MLAMLVPSAALGGGVPNSFAEAIEAYEFPSRDGDGPANAGMGTLELFGWGVELDYRKALDHFRSANDRGNARGATGLGILYANGYGGVVKQEFELAFRLLTAGAVEVRIPCAAHRQWLVQLWIPFVRRLADAALLAGRLAWLGYA